MEELVDRSLLEAVAKVLGPQSGAARALRCADKYEGEVRFYRAEGVIRVVELKPAPGGPFQEEKTDG